MALGSKIRQALGAFFARETGQDAREASRGWSGGGEIPFYQMDSYPVAGQEYAIPLFDDTLLARYARYEEMDLYPETSLVADLYADDCTVKDQIRHHVIWAQSTDRAIEKILNAMINHRRQPSTSQI